MSNIDFQMDGSLARAARHLTKVSARTIARRAGIDAEALRGYEKGGDTLTEAQIQAVAEALVHYGVLFVAEDEVGGVGVRRKFTRTSVQRIETWEGEGGPVGDDDI